MDTKIEKIFIDGRRSETHITEQPIDGFTERITEHFEEIVPLEKKKRIVERIAPVVVERTTEQFNGIQVIKTVEKVSPELHAAKEERVAHLVTETMTSPVPIKLVSASSVVSNLIENPIIGYILIVLLAVQVGFVAWQVLLK